MPGLIGDALDFRDQRRSVVESLLVNNSLSKGVAKCDGPNTTEGDNDTVETEVEVVFPTEYIDEPFPFLTPGLSVDSTKVSGMLPEISATRLRWITVQRQVEMHYVGMVIGVVVTGPVGTKVDLSWAVIGKAYVGAMPDGTT